MANRHWVGGSGTWDASSTTNWSTTSGGASGASAPTSADTAIFDSASGTGTCTTASDAACSATTLNSSTLGLTLGANLTMSGQFLLTLGTLSLSSYSLTCSVLNANNSNTRTIDFGTGEINLTGNNATIWVTTSTGFTCLGTSKVNCTYSGGTGIRVVSVGASGESNAITFNITAGTDTFRLQGTGGSYKNIDFTGFSGILTVTNSVSVFGNIKLSSTMTTTAGTTSITFAATSGTQQITTNSVVLDFPLIFNGVGGTFQLQDNCTVGSTRTVTLTNGTLDLNDKTLSTGIFSSNNSNTRSVLFGAGNITVTGSGATIYSTATATGLTFTGTPVVNFTYSGSTGTRTINGPSTDASINNAATCNISAGSDIVTFGASNRPCIDVNFTGFTGTCPELPKYLYGSLILSSGMTLGSTTGSPITFGATSGTKTITIAGKTIDNPIVFNGIGGTWSFSDALTQNSTRAFTIINGTVKLKAGATSTVGAFATSGSNQKYLQSTTAGSQATLSQASGTVTVSYLNIKDIAATGGATWNAYVDYNNVDQGDNTGWDFSYSPAIDNEFPVALRSFTQPKRF